MGKMKEIESHFRFPIEYITSLNATKDCELGMRILRTLRQSEEATQHERNDP